MITISRLPWLIGWGKEKKAGLFRLASNAMSRPQCAPYDLFRAPVKNERERKKEKNGRRLPSKGIQSTDTPHHLIWSGLTCVGAYSSSLLYKVRMISDAALLDPVRHCCVFSGACGRGGQADQSITQTHAIPPIARAKKEKKGTHLSMSEP